MWTLAYETIGNHGVNPFPIDFIFPSSPVILTAIGIDQRNLFRRLGRLTFLKIVPNIGITRGTSFVIFRGNQALKTDQLIDNDYKGEFYLYGYVPQIKIQVWVSTDSQTTDEIEKQLKVIEKQLDRIEAKIDRNEIPININSGFDNPASSGSIGII